jgi:aquaporin-4
MSSKEFYNYSSIEYLLTFTIEFFATLIVIFLMASPASIAPLIGGLDFSTNPIIILFIAIANGFAVYAVHATYNRFGSGYTNPIIALTHIIYTEGRRYGYYIIFKFILILIAEIIGSILAVLLIWGIVGDRGTDFGRPNIGPNFSVEQAFGYEIFGTFIYITISILANFKFGFEPDRSLVTGLLLFVVVLIGVPISGASLNYIRHFSSTLVSNSWKSSDWIYYVGPTISGIVSFIFILIIMYYDYKYPYSSLLNKKKKSKL